MQFSKNFPLPKNGGHFEFSNFCQKWQNTKNFPLPKNGGHFKFSNFCQKWLSLTVRDRVISSKFSTYRVSKEYLLPCEIERFRGNFRPTGYLRNVIFAIFKKIFPSPKMAAILNFRIFAKNGKTQISFYLLNRVTHRVSKECNLCNFQKIFPSPKMAAILNFRIFAKNGKTQICFYLLNRAR